MPTDPFVFRIGILIWNPMEIVVPMPGSRSSRRRSANRCWIATAEGFGWCESIYIADRNADVDSQTLYGRSIVVGNVVQEIHCLGAEYTASRDPILCKIRPVEEATLCIGWLVSIVNVDSSEARHILKQEECGYGMSIQACMESRVVFSF